MTKTELQSALAEATQTDKRTAGVFLDTLSALAYKEIKRNGEFVLPGFGKLVKQKRKARTGFNPKTQQKIKIPAKTVVKFRVAKAALGSDPSADWSPANGRSGGLHPKAARLAPAGAGTKAINPSVFHRTGCTRNWPTTATTTA